MTSDDSKPRLTHGRHCRCSACARQDWAEPYLAPCGMHGPSCPPIYDPYPAQPKEPTPTSDDSKAALAWAWHELRNGRREPPCKVCSSEAANMLAALDGWTLVPVGTAAADVQREYEEQRAEIARLRVALRQIAVWPGDRKLVASICEIALAPAPSEPG